MNAIYGFVAFSIIAGIPVALVIGLYLKMFEGTKKPIGEEEGC